MSKPEVTAVAQPLRENAMVGAPFEGADRMNRETALWNPSIRSADDDMKGQKLTLDSRARDLMRNDAYVSSAVTAHKDSIVGAFFTLNAAPNIRVLKSYNKGFDETWSEEFQAEAEAKFGLWAESPDNWPDASRHLTFTGLVRLAVGSYTLAGEVLATAEWLRDTARPYRTALQMIDLDRLSNPNGMDDTLYLRQGVERDRFGAPLAYNIRMSHPFSSYVGSDSYTWKRVPVRKPWGRIQVLHIFERQRPDQSRGVAEMVSALKEMRMTKKFREITLQNAVVNATYAAAIESELPPEQVYAQIGGEAGMPQAISDYLTGLSQYVGASRNLHIDGVKIPHLYPGTKLKLLPAGQPGGVGTVFEESLLRNVAAGAGLSYEEFAHDFSKSNYSSARAAMLNTHKGMQARKKMCADRFAGHLYALWVEEALARGDLPLPSGVSRDFFYEGQNKDALCAATWIGANRGQIDELKETQAAIMRIRAGLSTYEAEGARMGIDWRVLFKQAAKEKRLMEELGLEFNADPSKGAGLGGSGVKDDKEPGRDTGRLGPGSGNDARSTGDDDTEQEDDDVE